MTRSSSPNRRRALADLGAIALVPALAPFALPAKAQGSGAVVIYTSNNAQAFEAVQDVARKKMPGVKVSAITGGSGQLLRRLEARSPALIER